MADIFRNYKLNPAKFLSTLGLAWEPTLKKTELKLEFLTDIDMLFMVERGIRGGISHLLTDMENVMINT